MHVLTPELIQNGFVSDPEKKVQGFALYAEFYREESKKYYQIFFTPDGYDEKNNFVTARVFRRELTPEKPKKQWRPSSLRTALVNPESTQELVNAYRVEPIEPTLMRLQAYFKLVKEPFYVEVSKKDLTDIREGKTPIKVIYRIGQTRTALGFAEMFPEA